MHDERLFALPHPRRFALMNYLPMLLEVGKSLAIDFGPLLHDPGAGYHDAVCALEDNPGFRRFARDMDRSPGGARFGALKSEMMAARFAALPGSLFQTTDALEALLGETRLPEDIPCGVLRSPYPCLFIEFGETRNSPLQVMNPISGAHVLEGVYVMEDAVSVRLGDNIPGWMNGLAAEGEVLRVINLDFIGSPLGKENLADDAHQVMTLYLPDDEEPLSAAFDRCVSSAWSHGGGTRGAAERIDEQCFRACLWHLACALLYIQSSEVRREWLPEESEARAALGRLGAKKRARAERRLPRLYDRVRVGPQALPPELVGGGGGGAVRPHWRRGHFRHQRVGPGREKREVRYIAPTLVRADRISDTPPPTKPYSVR
ncbi:hypothetical protein J2T57_001733 [Natronocella acetinitrilica]|uniref:Uncharacterized protein n=2 Tax=Natronocella acetinitrilica TaxID=414046 RepID=A0AAE3KBG0_9GAMM|nr:hypothetical protein [Natronocella acetinitrilica]